MYEETYAIDTKNFDTIVSAMKAADPDVVVHGAVFEDGVGLVRAMLKAGFTPDWFYQTSAPSLGQQYADAIGEENTEGILFTVSHAPSADTPGNAEFVAKYKEMFDGAEPPEDAADAYAAGQVLQAAAEAVGDIEDQEGMADWLHDNKVSTILGDLEWNDDGSPNGDFLIGQWQDGEVQFVLPEEFATTDELVKGWKPGGASDDGVAPDASPRSAARRRVRPDSEWVDPDLRRHAGHQHRPRLVPDPGRVHHLVALGRVRHRPVWSQSCSRPRSCSCWAG